MSSLGRHSAADLLSLWEFGARRHAIDRGLLLFARARPELDPDTLADRPLGECHAALLELRQAWFGPRIACFVDCPSCRQRLELELSTAEFLERASDATASSIELAERRFRLPTSRDLAAVSGAVSEAAAALQLLRRCEVNASEAGAELGALAELEERFEAADPLAAPALSLTCVHCEHAWLAPFDIAGLLWDEVSSAARRVLGEVDVLARAYGWSEPEILALGEARRAAYLELVMS